MQKPVYNTQGQIAEYTMHELFAKQFVPLENPVAKRNLQDCPIQTCHNKLITDVSKYILELPKRN